MVRGISTTVGRGHTRVRRTTRGVGGVVNTGRVSHGSRRTTSTRSTSASHHGVLSVVAVVLRIHGESSIVLCVLLVLFISVGRRRNGFRAGLGITHHGLRVGA